MTQRRFANLDPLGETPIPRVVLEVADGRSPELVWRNELGGLTFRIEDQYLKWDPPGTGIDLERERDRLGWLSGRHPAPQVLAWGTDEDAQWLLTARIPGESAVSDGWRARPSEATRAIATGLRTLHALPIDDVPPTWATEVWSGRAPEALGPRPPVDRAAVVHGDACVPNTLISPTGEWVGHVDLGDLAVGDRWADLAVASMSLDWNYGRGHQAELFETYGVEPDDERIRYYRALWKLES